MVGWIMSLLTNAGLTHPVIALPDQLLHLWWKEGCKVGIQSPLLRSRDGLELSRMTILLIIFKIQIVPHALFRVKTRIKYRVITAGFMFNIPQFWHRKQKEKNDTYYRIYDKALKKVDLPQLHMCRITLRFYQLLNMISIIYPWNIFLI